MKPITAIDDPRYVKAISHPVRVRIMAMLLERKASPNELSQWLGTTLGATAYHVRTLHKLGLIDLVDETRVRGAVEHHYKAKAPPRRSNASWERISPVAKQAEVGSALRMLEDYTHASAAAGGFDRPEATLQRTKVTLDAKGWKALAAESQKYLDRVAKIETDAAKRIARVADQEDVVDAGVVLLSFEFAPLGNQLPQTAAKVRAKAAPKRRSRRG